MRKLLLIMALLIAAPLLAQDPAPAVDTTQPKKPAVIPKVLVKPEAAAPVAATTAVEHKATGTVEHLAPDATTEEVMEAAFATVEEAQKYFAKRDSDTKKAFTWAGILAAVLNLLLVLVSRLSPFWRKTRGKWIIRLITLTLGVAAGVVSNMALGMPWWDAAVMFMSGPGAVLIHEYRKMIPFLKPKKEEK